MSLLAVTFLFAYRWRPSPRNRRIAWGSLAAYAAALAWAILAR